MARKLVEGKNAMARTWPSEITINTDNATGRAIRKLTAIGNNVHLYFTENSFDASEPAIIFLSDRASGEDRAPHEDPCYNVFCMDLISGEITQLTDEPDGVVHVTKTPDSQIIVYITGQRVRALDTATGITTTIYEETGAFSLGAPSIAPNRRYVAFCRNEQVDVPRGPDYSGFKESFYRIKDGRVTIAYLDGSRTFDVWRDTHWLGHFQFCPIDSTIGSFCHEGPWHLVTQRIWLLDFVAREAFPCFRQAEEDSVGHEFWTQGGLIFFDNRGPGHDGTITSRRTQAVAVDVTVKGILPGTSFRPFIGLADRSGRVIRRIDMPYSMNHYHASPDATLLVGDDVDDLVLIDISGEEARLHVLVHNHGTSWYTQSSHCHPTWSWDGKHILYASDQGGRVNLYLVDP
jgi:oligogalacturonide lyase